MGNGVRVEVVSSQSCSKLFVGFPTTMPSSRGVPMDPAMSPAVSSTGSRSGLRSSNAPFSGLVICVTGLSKEERKQVMEATERLGGKYSPDLHPQCTHLVVQSFGGRKFEHALKHGSRNGLFVVALGWFVESVKRNVRLNESSYSVKNLRDDFYRMDELTRIVGFTGAENSCLPPGIHNLKKPETNGELRPRYPGKGNHGDAYSRTLSGRTIYVDSDISANQRNKVIDIAIKEGATLLNKWFVGCSTTDVVSYCNNLTTPLWILKTAKEKEVQRLVHLSADLARQLSTLLGDCQIGDPKKENGDIAHERQCNSSKLSLEERQQIVEFAKNGVRNRRGGKMQTCKTPMSPITPSSLLNSICWLVSEPTSTASIYTDSLGSNDDKPPVFFDAKADGKESKASFANLSRPLTESEKSKLVFKENFLTILFPVDRFSEMGPSSRTFFGQKGFMCLKVLDHIYEFYQENLSSAEIEAAIHTDSRHADRLRSGFATKESADDGFVEFIRPKFLGRERGPLLQFFPLPIAKGRIISRIPGRTSVGALLIFQCQMK